MRQVVLGALCFFMGYFTCRVHGTYWLYPLFEAMEPKDKNNTLGVKAAYTVGMFFSFALFGGIVYSLKRISTMDAFSMIEKSLMLACVFYFIVREDEDCYFLSVKLKGNRAFKGFIMGIESIAVNQLYMGVYIVLLATHQLRIREAQPVIIFTAAFIGITATFFLTGRKVAMHHKHIYQMEEATKWKNALLALMLMGLFL